MVRQFAPKHFLRMAPNVLLGEYFRRGELLQDVSFDDRDEVDIGEIYDAWQKLAPQPRSRVDADFRDVDSLSTEEGTAALLREAQFMGGHLDDVESADGFHDRALGSFLNQREIFDRVLRVSASDNLPPKYWYKRSNLPDVNVRTDQAILDSLGNTLRFFFKEREGRGQVCIPDSFEREGTTYYFCYLEDFGRAEIEFGEGDRLERRTKRPHFEVIFAVSPARASLDTFYLGSRQTIRTLETLFARVVFGIDLPDKPSDTVYELNGLKDRRFPFVYDATMGITRVAVKKLRFTAIGGIRRRKTLEADPSENREAIYDFMDEDFDTSAPSSPPSGKTPLAAFNITQAVIVVTLQPRRGRSKPTKTFSISFPNACSLGQEGEEAIIREMLRRSGIERVAPASAQKELVGAGAGPS